MPPQGDLSFLDKSFSNIRAISANFLTFKEGLGLWKAKTERNNKDRRTCAKPEQLKFVSIEVLR
jgi:hypothetical protein